MPELPEVETTVNSLNILKNKKVIMTSFGYKNLYQIIHPPLQLGLKL